MYLAKKASIFIFACLSIASVRASEITVDEAVAPYKAVLRALKAPMSRGRGSILASKSAGAFFKALAGGGGSLIGLALAGSFFDDRVKEPDPTDICYSDAHDPGGINLQGHQARYAKMRRFRPLALGGGVISGMAMAFLLYRMIVGIDAAVARGKKAQRMEEFMVLWPSYRQEAPADVVALVEPLYEKFSLAGALAGGAKYKAQLYVWLVTFVQTRIQELQALKKKDAMQSKQKVSKEVPLDLIDLGEGA